VDRLCSLLGAELKRCQDCRQRYAYFKLLTVPLGIRAKQAGVSSPVWASVGFAVCLLAVLWIVRRLAMQG
jgi:hypothetical protein